MLNEVKHLGCAHVDVHEILLRIPPNCLVGAYAIRPYMGCLRIFKKINSALLRLYVP